MRLAAGAGAGLRAAAAHSGAGRFGGPERRRRATGLAERTGVRAPQPQYAPPPSQVQPGQYPSATPPAAQAATPATARLDVRMTQLEQDLRTVTGRLEEVTYQLRRLDERLNKVAADVDYRLSQTKTGEGDQAATHGRRALRRYRGHDGCGRSSRRCGGRSRSAAFRRGTSSPAAGQTAAYGAAEPARAVRRRLRSVAKSATTTRRRPASATSSSRTPATRWPTTPATGSAKATTPAASTPRSAEIFLDGYEKNKSGPKAPDTLLKLGLSLAGLQKNKEACASFRELNRAFPNAPAAVKERAGQETKRLACT